VIKAVEEIKKAEVKVLQNKEWREEEGLLLKEEKAYVPKYKELRMEIIHLYHNILVAEHGRQWKTMKLVTRNFW